MLVQVQPLTPGFMLTPDKDTVPSEVKAQGCGIFMSWNLGETYYLFP